MAQEIQDAKKNTIEVRYMIEDFEQIVSAPGASSVDRLEDILKQLDAAA
ncbi:MAG: hypothetical protein GY696_26135, partial [Gammaproteobacteria bacterium]|nr:hypothetical protein [Gammaproteobacteria bacterium]